MKPLLPTLKERKRYIVYELLTEKPLQASPERAIIEHLDQMLGIFDGAAAGLLSVKYDAKLQTGILRVSHTMVEKVKIALLLLENLGTTKVIPRVLGVSGILKKTERFFPEKRTIIKGDTV